MKRITSVLVLILFFSLNIFSQKKEERRVYYLDYSYSMVTNNIWDTVKENLKKAINNVSDETTELFVIPFTDDNKNHVPLQIFHEVATSEGKSYLKRQIDHIECDKNCYTMHFVPLNDFLTNRIDANKINYMFLMTDGKNSKKIDDFNRLLSTWSNKIGNKDIYGFYVMLCPKAKDDKVLNLINSQKNLWNVESADVNINIVHFENGIYNVRNDKFVEIPYSGILTLNDVQIQLKENPYYELIHIEKSDSSLKLQLKEKMSKSLLPDNTNIQLIINDKKEDFTFIVNEKININCINKKEFTFKINIL